MKTHRTYTIILVLFPFFIYGNSIPWEKLEASVFSRAKENNKLILLNVEANWCHWCHVMENSTYNDPEVAAYIMAHYIPVKVDQDAFPELANRYRDYGWPATIFLNAEAKDVVKRRGYISAAPFLRLLKAIVNDPSPEEPSQDLLKVNTQSANENALLLQTLKNSFLTSLDYDKGGFNQAQKYIDAETFEYALFYSKNDTVNTWVSKSVAGAKKLSDPAWGGIYQYSTHNDWEHLHYEKLLAIQARYLSIFIWNYYYYNDENSLTYAKGIMQYVNRFLLTENGLYANAQDADLIQGNHSADYFSLPDAERIQKGIPRIDKHTYTDTNAAMGIALLKLYRATGNKVYLERANIIRKKLLNRKNNQGFFAHEDEARAIVSLKDQISMAEFMIACIKNNSNDAESQHQLQQLVDLIQFHFGLKNGALKSFLGNNGLAPQPVVSENIRMARIFNWYSHYTGNIHYKQRAEEMYRFLTSKPIAENYYTEPGVLMLATELDKEPTQYVYLNRNTDNKFNDELHGMIPFYSMIYDGKLHEIPAEKQDLISEFQQNVVLLCTSNYCSSPIYTKKELRQALLNKQF